METLREVLATEFSDRRKLNPNYSLRGFARWLGVSPAQLSQLLSGKRPATAKMTQKISGRLGLSPSERNRILATTMPGWADETTPATKRQILTEDRFRLIADWYHFAILGLTKTPGAKTDPRWIARRLGISSTEARQALDRLVRLGVLQLEPNFKQIGDPLNVTSQIPSEAIRRFHKQILALGMERIETIAMENRQFEALTISVNPSKIPLAKKMIGEFLEKMEEVLESGKHQEVYSLAVQLFPMSLKPENGNKS